MREKMITIWDELVQMNKVRPYVLKRGYSVLF